MASVESGDEILVPVCGGHANDGITSAGVDPNFSEDSGDEDDANFYNFEE